MVTTTIKPKEKKTKTFPWLGIARTSGSVILFTANKTGMRIYSKDGDLDVRPIGEYSTDWDMSIFEEYHDEVILKNEE